ncbi:MAG: hypothetical protein IJN78_01085 [Clostridia bacterium]|nr:hypothetical protein [Clostridia bacterium]MBQ7043178.1 hypothetical protein [Clostridia bacterium]
MSKKNLSNSEKMNIKQQLTLPWLIISIASIVSFMAFLIAMFFQFYTAVFFAVFLCVIASAVFLDGVHKKKQNYISGNINFIMAILCVICAVVVISM